ncbi:hypothetical protein EB796_000911 [Bugula neritina]|uniref:Uncharacterized protein n=1 Tax=Bugula neritina TaxID=10212 RepID=A0A7J7KRI3_BUGNE|nr:hypothetical protein EB796_000911 [Bugula neritina]
MFDIFKKKKDTTTGQNKFFITYRNTQKQQEQMVKRKTVRNLPVTTVTKGDTGHESVAQNLFMSYKLKIC